MLRLLARNTGIPASFTGYRLSGFDANNNVISGVQASLAANLQLFERRTMAHSANELHGHVSFYPHPIDCTIPVIVHGGDEPKTVALHDHSVTVDGDTDEIPALTLLLVTLDSNYVGREDLGYPITIRPVIRSDYSKPVGVQAIRWEPHSDKPYSRLRSKGLQTLAHRRILRIGIKAAAAEQRHLDE